MQTVFGTVSRRCIYLSQFQHPSWFRKKKKKWGDLLCFLKLFVQMIVFARQRMTNRCKSHLAFKECQGRVHLSTKLPTLWRQLSTPAWVFYWRQPYYKILLVQWTLSSTTLFTPSVLPFVRITVRLYYARVSIHSMLELAPLADHEYRVCVR